MQITVKYFASIREAIGQGSEQIDTPAATVAALRDDTARLSARLARLAQK